MAHVCPWWGGYFIDNPMRRWLHNPRRILSPFVSEGMTAVDFGCGMGMFSLMMAELVGPRGQVIAIDVQPRMLEVLNARAAKAHLADRIAAHLCQPNYIGLEVAVDFALAFYSVHEVPDPDRLIQELHELLRPEGRLLLVEPRFHVSRAAFGATLQKAAEAGFHITDRPKLWMSHAAVLTKP